MELAGLRETTGWRTRGLLLAAAGVAMAGASLRAVAVDGPSLGAARSFAVLGHETVTNTDTATIVTGDLGVWPGTAVEGFPPGIVTGGEIHATDPRAERAQGDAAIAYDFLAGMAPGANLTGSDLGTLAPLGPGVYKFNDSAQLTGALVLDAGGDSGAVFVFQIGSSLTTATGSSVTVINGGSNYDESKIFWQVSSSATLGSGTSFRGMILAYASISMDSGASLVGSALAITGAVTLDFNAVTCPPNSGNADNGRPTKGRTRLLPPVGPASRAFALLDWKHFPENHGRDERSWLRIKARHLEPSTDYTLWADDPSTESTALVQFDSITTRPSGNVNYALDTKKGDALPFGATLAALSGRPVEVRNAAGTTTLLGGTIPTASP